MKAAIYARFSSDNQNEMSIDAQVRACEEYAHSKLYEIARIYKDEAISGTTANRAEYQEMLADAVDGKFDIILIHKYDRIARNLEEQVMLNSRLKKLNINLIAVAQNYGEGKDADLTKGIQWVLGEYYSANLAEETRKGHQETALKALHNGGVPPFGYDIINQKYVINEREAYYVRKMFETCLGGDKYKYLIEEMKIAGITGKRGKHLEYTQIYEILHNEKYTGTYVYSVTEEKDRAARRSKPNAIRIENAIPSIIDKETFVEAQKILSEHKHSGLQKHPCSGLVYCSCGAKMYISHTERKGHKYTRFICSKSCGAHGISADKIDAAVERYMDEVLSEKNIDAVKDAIKEYRFGEIERAKKFENERKKQIAEKEEAITNIINAIASGVFETSYDLLSEKLSKYKKEIEDLNKTKAPEISDKKIYDWLDDVKTKSPKGFIENIKVDGEQIIITSTFGNIGCGGGIDMFPALLYRKKI